MESMTETGSTARPAPRARTKLVTLAALVALVVYTVTRPSTAGVFEPSGAPIALPAAGALTELSADAFEGVLVGLHGKPVIVNIWASWCSPCRTETPLLERTWKAHKNDVVILGVGSKDVPSNLVAFMNEFGVSYPNVFDSSGEIRARLGLRGFPTTYVFGADGRLRTTIVGGLTEQRLAAVLEDLRA